MNHPSNKRGRGRPRSSEVDRAILLAAFRVLLDGGLSSFTLDHVAAEAGVAKTTIYRRYANREALIAEAVARALVVDEPPETEDTRAALRDLFLPAPLGEIGSWPARARLIADILAHAEETPTLAALLRDRVARPRLAAVRETIRAATERGEVREGVDAESVAAAIFGGMLAREVMGLPSTAEGLDALIDTVWRGIEVR